MAGFLRRSEFIAGLSTSVTAGVLMTVAQARPLQTAQARPLHPFGSVAQARPLQDIIRVRIFGSDIAHVDFASDAKLTLSVPSGSFSVAAASFDLSTPGLVSADGRQLQAGAPSIISAPGSVVANAVFGSGRSVQRRYGGTMALIFESSTLTIINYVKVEDYVASTLASEVSPSWHAQALKAQAIASRTFALAARARSTKRAFDVTDDTSSQVYHGSENIAEAFLDAAAATSGRVLFAGASIAEIYYSSVCGGHTAAVAELTGRAGASYLEGVADTNSAGRSYCERAPYYQWKNSIPVDAMARAIGMEPGLLGDVAVVERWPDGRIKTIRATRADGGTVDFDGHKFYRMAAAALGYKVVPSAMFDLQRSGGAFALSGRGLGHGVGMCQWGARGRAEAGAAADAILAAYFPGTTLR